MSDIEKPEPTYHFYFSPGQVPPERGEYLSALTLTLERNQALRLIRTIAEAVETTAGDDLVQFTVEHGIGEWKAYASADADGEAVDPMAALLIRHCDQGDPR